MSTPLQPGAWASVHTTRAGDHATAKTTYAAGWNMPGYLPEMDPAEFEGDDAEAFSSAVDFLCSELERDAEATADGFDDPDGKEARDACVPYDEAIEALEAAEPGDVTVFAGNLAYWIHRNEG